VESHGQYVIIAAMRSLLAACSLLFLAACVAPPPTFFTPAAEQTLPPPPPDRAQIVFLHPGGGLIAMLGHVYELNGEQRQYLGTVGAKTKLVHNVPPGKHLFMSNSVGYGHILEADVDPGKRYYVLMRYVHGRGQQMRPIRNAGGDPEFTVGNPQFRQWLTESQVVNRTADAEAWQTQYKSFNDDAYARGWKEWQEKRPDQRAELTLNREDSVNLQ
jgi:hypothetical protein